MSGIDQTEMRSELANLLWELSQVSRSRSAVGPIEILGVCAAVPSPILRRLSAAMDDEEAWSAVNAAALMAGFEKPAISMFRGQMEQIGWSLIEDVATFFEDYLGPSPELLDEVLMELSANKFRHEFPTTPVGLGHLITEIATSYHSDTRNYLCEGSRSDTCANSAVSVPEVVQALPLVGGGRTLRRCLRAIGGSRYRLEDESWLLSEEPETQYAAAALCDAWGERSYSEPLSAKAEKPTPVSFSSDIRLLPILERMVDGRIVCLVSPGWLLKQVGADGDYKQRLLRSGAIEAVIQLPGRIFTDTALAAGLLVLNTHKRHEIVKFIDATEMLTAELLRVVGSARGDEERTALLELINSDQESPNKVNVPVEEVLKDRGALDPVRQVRYRQLFSQLESTQVGRLSEIAEVIQCQAFRRHDKDSWEAIDSEDQSLLEVRPNDIDRFGFIRITDDTRRFIPDEKDERRLSRQMIQRNDVLLCVKGRAGLAGMAEGDAAGTVGNQAFVILRPRGEGDLSGAAKFLHRYLRSGVFEELMGALQKGGTVKMIKTSDLKELPVPLLNEEQRREVLRNWEEIRRLADGVTRLEEEIEYQQELIWSSAASTFVGGDSDAQD